MQQTKAMHVEVDAIQEKGGKSHVQLKCRRALDSSAEKKERKLSPWF